MHATDVAEMAISIDLTSLSICSSLIKSILIAMPSAFLSPFRLF